MRSTVKTFDTLRRWTLTTLCAAMPLPAFAAAGELPFPADDGPAVVDATLRAEKFPTTTIRAFGDAAYTVSLAVPAGWKSLEGPAKGPTPGGPAVTLRGFRHPDGPAAGELELQVARLPQEMTADDWLRIAIARQGFETVQSRIRVGPTGPVADFLVRGRAAGGPVVLRLFALKDADRLFLLTGRAGAAAYPAVAEAFAAAIVTLRPAPSGQIYAEPLLSHVVGAPGQPTFNYFGSWKLQTAKGAIAPGIAGAMFKHIARATGGREDLQGLLTVKVVQKAENPDLAPDDLLAFMRQDLMDAGIALGTELGTVDFSTQSLPLAGKATRAEGKRNQAPVEFRGVVLQDNAAWYTLSLVGPTQAVNPAAWAVNRRALEVMALNAHPGR
jgi:hypothetical protein